MICLLFVLSLFLNESHRIFERFRRFVSFLLNLIHQTFKFERNCLGKNLYIAVALIPILQIILCICPCCVVRCCFPTENKKEFDRRLTTRSVYSIQTVKPDFF